MSKHFLIIACISAALACFANAQSDISADKKLLASGPLFVNPMPDPSQWAVDFTYTDAPQPGDTSRDTAQMERLQKAAQQDPALAGQLKNPQFLFSIKNIRPKRIVITKSGDIRHEERLMERDYKEESWRTGDVEVEQKANSKKLSVKMMSSFAARDFPELGWISLKNFVGIQSLNGRKCFAFEQERYDDEHQPIGKAGAYVDVDTRYPVAFRYLTQVYQYTILPPPATALTVPDEFAAAAKAKMEQIKKATARLAQP